MSADNRPQCLPRTRRVRRQAASVATAAAMLTLAACGSGGVSGGGDNTNFVAGDGGIAKVAEGQRSTAPRLTGESLHGKKLDLADYKGKIVVLNVWGSWCAPCRAEAPNFAKVYSEYKARGVQFVGINTRDSSRQPAISFERDKGITYPSYYDPTGKLMLQFKKGTLNPQLVPSTLVIDRDGKIAARALQALSEEKLRSMIKPVLAEK